MNNTKEIVSAVLGLALHEKTVVTWYNRFFTVIHLNIHNKCEFFTKDKNEKLRSYKPDQQKRALLEVASRLVADNNYMTRHDINKIYLCKDTDLYAAPFGRGNYLLLATSIDFDLDQFKANRTDSLEEIKISEEIKINTPTPTRSVDASSEKEFPTLVGKSATTTWENPPVIHRDEVLSPVTTVDDTLTAVTTQSIDSSLKTALEGLSKELFTKKELGKILFDLGEESLNNLLGNLTEATEVIYDNGLVKSNDNCQQPCHGQVPYGYYGPVPVPMHHQMYNQQHHAQTNGCDETSIKSMGSANM